MIRFLIFAIHFNIISCSDRRKLESCSCIESVWVFANYFRCRSGSAGRVGLILSVSNSVRVRFWLFRNGFVLIRYFKINSWIFFKGKTVFLNIIERLCVYFYTKRWNWYYSYNCRLLIHNCIKIWILFFFHFWFGLKCFGFRSGFVLTLSRYLGFGTGSRTREWKFALIRRIRF